MIKKINPVGIEQERMFKNILFLERALKHRNERYSTLEKNIISQQGSMPENKYNNTIKALPSMMYKIEIELFNRWEILTDKEKKCPADYKLSNESKLANSMTAQEYVSAKMFSKSVISKLRDAYPHVWANLKADIKDIAISNYGQYHGNAEMRLATMDLFKKEHPSIDRQFKQINDINLEKSNLPKDEKDALKCAKKLLATGALFANPSGAVLSKGIGLIMRTKAMRPLRDEVSKGIKNAIEKTGLVARFSNLYSSSKLTRAVTIGAAACGGVALVAVGLMEADVAIDHVASLADKVMVAGEVEALASTNADIAIEKISLADTNDIDNPASAADIIDSLQYGTTSNTTSLDSLAPMGESNFDANQSDIYAAIVQSSYPSQALQIASSNIYTAEFGDTLSEIVEQRLIDAGEPFDSEMLYEYTELVAANNNISDANIILENQIINLDSLPALEQDPIDAEIIKQPTVSPETWENTMTLKNPVEAAFQATASQSYNPDTLLNKPPEYSPKF